MKIYTKTGDGGSTGLYGGERRSKANVRIESYGEVDELQAVLGLAQAKLQDDLFTDISADLTRVQNACFVICTELARTETLAKRGDPVLSPDETGFLEKSIDRYSKVLPELRAFILQGGSELGATLHLARAVCRRAERAVVALAVEEEVDEEVIRYLNRLSDLLFTLARTANYRLEKREIEWHPEKRIKG